MIPLEPNVGIAGSEPVALQTLADRVGILSEYVDQSGKEVRVTSDETRVALLAAMGFDASTDILARSSLEDFERRERDQILPPVRVARHGPEANVVRARVPEGWTGPVGFELGLSTGKEEVQRRGRIQPDDDGFLTLSLAVSPEPGYHTVRVRLHHGSQHPEGSQLLVVTPHACVSPAQLTSERRAFGITANLYAVRGAGDWGIGDFGDLGKLIDWGSEIGATFVGVNPLHAIRNLGHDISPYSPVSRLYKNPIYLNITAIPELAECEEARTLIASDDFEARLAVLRAANDVRYDGVMRLKRRVLDLLYNTFVTRTLVAGGERALMFAEYLELQGSSLLDFATFLAIEEHLRRELGDAAPGWWRDWPEGLRDSKSGEVRAFQQSNATEIDFHRWLQFELDQQLAVLAAVARGRGMRIGVYQDLAVGSSPSGSDAWSCGNLLASGASIGAPPDMYAANGQNWGLPPLNPILLRRSRYEYWIALIRSAFRHSGALRIDHILGLFRQFWIPDGMHASRGAYVKFPVGDLLGILALESHLAHAIVVGEDLGTVPPEVSPTLKGWGVLSSKVLFFERGEWGSFNPAMSYEALSLTTADTHDMATLSGFWRARDIELNQAVGLISAGEADVALSERDSDRRLLVERLAAEGLLPAAVAPENEADLRGAVHDFLCRTPAALVGLAYDDIVGELDPVNIPGVGGDKYPSWTRRNGLRVEDLRSDPAVARSLGKCRDIRNDG
ncbi:MAG: 4-alpha-glucanotransferase [Anaerolineae bacterium]|nr:4-alpha-glucanotransferase [Gemmatimonadaceae bacterium]